MFSAETLAILTFIGINILLAWGAWIVFMTGQITLGQAAFMAIGAYVAGVLTVKEGLDLIPAMLVAGLVAAVFGAAVGFPALRLRGLYLALMTIGVGKLVVVFFSNLEAVGGVAGFPGPAGTTIGLVWATVGIALVFVWLLSHSRLGWAFEAIREDEVAAAAMGVNVTYLKVLAFALGGFMTAVAGALWAHFLLFISPANFGFFQSVLIVLFVVLGGMQTLWGPALGAAVLTYLPEAIRGLDAWRFFAFGAVLVAMMAVRPEGLVSRRATAVLGGLARSLAPGAKDRGLASRNPTPPPLDAEDHR